MRRETTGVPDIQPTILAHGAARVSSPADRASSGQVTTAERIASELVQDDNVVAIWGPVSGSCTGNILERGLATGVGATVMGHGHALCC